MANLTLGQVCQKRLPLKKCSDRAQAHLFADSMYQNGNLSCCGTPSCAEIVLVSHQSLSCFKFFFTSRQVNMS